MSSTDPDDWEEAREGPIKEFLQNYPNQRDDQSSQIQRWADLADVVILERRLKNWIAKGFDSDSEPEQLARDAVDLEDKGNPEKALKKWADLAEYKKKSNEDERIWGLLGEQRHTEQELKAFIRAGNLPPDKGPTHQAAWALYYEVFGDVWTARALWQQLRTDEEKTKQNTWFLLASRHLLKLRKVPDEDKAREQLLQEKLKTAADLAPKKPEEAKLIYRDIVNLYDARKDNQVSRLARQAEEGLKKLSPKPKNKGKP